MSGTEIKDNWFVELAVGIVARVNAAGIKGDK